MSGILLRVPDHLGDGVLALPAAHALSRLGPLRIEGPRWVPVLYREVAQAPVPSPDLAVLLKPAFRAAWQARRVPRRVGLRWDLRGPLLTDPVEPAGPGCEHRLEEYARIAELAGARVSGLPAFRPSKADGERAPALPENAVLLLPFSASGPTIEWPGHRALADLLASRGRLPVFAAGPGEDDRLRRLAGPHRALSALDLGVFAAVVARVSAVVGNDSGLSHLAAAARRGMGQAVEDVHVICGSTDPARTAPPGATIHRRSDPPPCAPCYKKRCAYQLECLALPAERVLTALSVGR